jgi:hypothetical protein
VGLFESRIFDLLSFLAFLHMVLFGVKRRRLALSVLVPLVLQVVLFVLLYHARSSLGWQVLAVGLLALVRAVRTVVADQRRGWPTARALVQPLLPFVLLAAGLTALSVYKAQAYHPSYFAEQGSRTFWHNALMGYRHPQLMATYGVDVDDRAIARLVIGRMKARHDPRLTDNWEVEKAMNSLGGYGTFDWRTYEEAARETYWSIWREHPRWALINYLWYKPAAVVREIRQLTWPSAVGEMPDTADAYRYQPLRWWPLALALAALGLLRTTELRRLTGPYARATAFIAPVSLIPALAFYAAPPTLMGFLVILTLGVYLGVSRLVLSARLSWCAAVAPVV